jgi:hypothetical protein
VDMRRLMIVEVDDNAQASGTMTMSTNNPSG